MTTSPRLPAGTGTVAVPGGDLAYEVLGGTSEPVLAIHGISSHRRLWSWLHAEAPDLTLVAPELRGRADSVDVPGPYDLARHADDLALLLDAVDLQQVPVIGMSMGGFVALELRHRHPDRVASLVLVDGGFPLQPPPGLTPDNVELAFADRLGRLGRRWETVDAYLDYFRSTTGPLLDRDDPLLRHYVEHDLRDGVVRLSPEAIVGDSRDIFFGSVPWQDVGVPVRWLHAQWAVGPGSTPMYSAEAVERYAPQCASVVGLDGLDHAASIMSPAGASGVSAGRHDDQVSGVPGGEDSVRVGLVRAQRPGLGRRRLLPELRMPAHQAAESLAVGEVDEPHLVEESADPRPGVVGQQQVVALADDDPDGRRDGNRRSDGLFEDPFEAGDIDRRLVARPEPRQRREVPVAVERFRRPLPVPQPESIELHVGEVIPVHREVGHARTLLTVRLVQGDIQRRDEVLGEGRLAGPGRAGYSDGHSLRPPAIKKRQDSSDEDVQIRLSEQSGARHSGILLVW